MATAAALTHSGRPPRRVRYLQWKRDCERVHKDDMSRRSQIRQVMITKEEHKEIGRRIRKAKDRKPVDRLRVVLHKADGYKHHVIAHLL